MACGALSGNPITAVGLGFIATGVTALAQGAAQDINNNFTPGTASGGKK